MKLFLIFIAIIAFQNCTGRENEYSVEINADRWGKFFESRNLDGTFLLKKFNSDSLLVFNKKRAGKPYLPASTFKILNSLISLETEVIADENQIIEWDGKKRFYDKWNQDQNLRSAFRYSCVWFYQELARRIGRTRMEEYLAESRYGNMKTGKDIDTFWLEGDLRISGYEQIKFLEKFLRRDLPFSIRNFNIVKSIMLVDSSDNYKLFAKTGWTARVDEETGWYIGFVENRTGTWLFVNNFNIKENSDSQFREKITLEILRLEGLI